MLAASHRTRTAGPPSIGIFSMHVDAWPADVDVK
jgi:hypothetical protein